MLTPLPQPWGAGGRGVSQPRWGLQPPWYHGAGYGQGQLVHGLVQGAVGRGRMGEHPRAPGQNLLQVLTAKMEQEEKASGEGLRHDIQPVEELIPAMS